MMVDPQQPNPRVPEAPQFPQIPRNPPATQPEPDVPQHQPPATLPEHEVQGVKGQTGVPSPRRRDQDEGWRPGLPDETEGSGDAEIPERRHEHDRELPPSEKKDQHKRMRGEARKGW